MGNKVFRSAQAQEIIAYVREEYGDELEFLWQRLLKAAIWRKANSTIGSWHFRYLALK